MEYALVGLLYIFRELLNSLFAMPVVNGQSIGSALIALLIMRRLLPYFSMNKIDSSDSSGSKTKSEGGDRTS